MFKHYENRLFLVEYSVGLFLDDKHYSALNSEHHTTHPTPHHNRLTYVPHVHAICTQHSR